jgi:endonuclease/exonuclease/phosphatase family metal-dependent hydrolase
MYRSPARSRLHVGSVRWLFALLLALAAACSERSPTDPIAEATSTDYITVDVEPSGANHTAPAVLRAARAGNPASTAVVPGAPMLGPHTATYLAPGHLSGLQGVALKVRIRAPRGTGPYTWNIDWGDGFETQTTVERLGEFVFLRAQPYAAAGRYRIAAVATDSRGATSNVAFATVTVPGVPSVSVLTRNLYIGTSISAVLAAPPEYIPVYVAGAYGEVVASRPAERMAAIADEIATHRPDLVGLQEVSTFYLQVPGDYLSGNAVQASDLQYDYLALLLDALRARGINYSVAAVTHNVDIELPAFDPAASLWFDVRLQDRDVILVREGVKHWNARNDLFAAYIPISLAGGLVNFEFRRGWTSVDAEVHGRELRFVNTHLETQDAKVVNEAQGAELLALFRGSPLPVLMVGDFNSAANASAPAGKHTATYGAVLAEGFTDLWSAVYPDREGLTCCHADDLLNTTVDFTQRIDFIFFGPGFGGAGEVDLLGNRPSERTASGRWPSDHAGVFGRVRLP